MFEIGSLIAGGLGWVGSNLTTYLFRKGMDRLFSTKEDLEKELAIIINQVVDDYEKQNPQQDIAGMYTFYKSQKVVDELLQYRLMHSDEYKAEQLLNAFNQDDRVIPPTLPQITAFYDIFTRKVEEHPKLKSIEINSTFQEEIFEISSKLDNLSRKIEYILRLSNVDLELQWKDRIGAYIDTLKAFKPQTAISLLIALEKSFDESTKKPNNEFKSKIKYQEGVCYQFLGNEEESSKAFIVAYTLNQTVQSYKEKAALAYYKLSDKKTASKLSDELLKENPFNPVACGRNANVAGDNGIIDFNEFSIVSKGLGNRQKEAPRTFRILNLTSSFFVK
jgi:tetratricopeptide (TPR) repeat protein